MNWNPNDEGKTHINAYSKSQTRLGRLLSNFANTPFRCNDGDFRSIEGYWYWLSTDHPEKEQLRKLYGYHAKQTGRKLRGADWPKDSSFREKIKAALDAKIQQTQELQNLLKKNNLPIVHYYAYGGQTVTPAEGQWIWSLRRP